MDRLTFEDSCIMSDYMDIMPVIAAGIAERYNLFEKCKRVETEEDLKRIMVILEHYLWVGFCDGKGWE